MRFAGAFHLIGALKTALQSLPLLWRRVWPVLLLLFVVVSVSQSAFLAQGGGLWARRGLIVLAIFVEIAAAGALYRLSLFGDRYAKSEGLGHGGLQFGKPERRLVAAGLLVGLFWLMVFATLAVVLALFFGASGLEADRYATPSQLFAALIEGPQPQGVILGVTLLAVCLTLGILTVKLWLHRAATVAEHRVVSLNALSLSSGQTVRLFLGYVYILLPFIAITAAVPELGGVGPLIDLALGIGLFLPLSVAFLAAAYRQISALRAKG